jgi:hypothetical protein
MIKELARPAGVKRRKPLIPSHLQAWPAALDDFRNWLVREAA